MSETKYDVLIVGSGPGGYKAAENASKAGLTVAVVERSEIGGICTNWGCIPTKALLKSAEVIQYINSAKTYGIEPVHAQFQFADILARSRKIANQTAKGVELLLEKSGVHIIVGTASLKSAHIVEVVNNGVATEYTAKHIIIATGAKARILPTMPFDGENIISYKEALSLSVFPKSMAVIGSGAIGVELAYFYASLGCSVSLFEAEEQILPAFDADIADQVTRALKKLKVKVFAGARVSGVVISDGGVQLTAQCNNKEIVVAVDKLLVAAGISPNTGDLCIQNAGVECNEFGYIITNDLCQTSTPNVYAIGDVRTSPALAHVAYAEASIAVNAILNIPTKNLSEVPFCIYSKPEIGIVGLTEKQAERLSLSVEVKKYSFSALGKATATGDRDGFVKLIVDKETTVVLGGAMVGSTATENIAMLTFAVKSKSTLEDLCQTIFPHPSFVESIWEAASH